MANPDCPYCGGRGIEDAIDPVTGQVQSYTVPCHMCGGPCPYCGTLGDCIHWQGDGWSRACADKKNMFGPYSIAAKRSWPYYWRKGYFDPED